MMSLDPHINLYDWVSEANQDLNDRDLEYLFNQFDISYELL